MDLPNDLKTKLKEKAYGNSKSLRQTIVMALWYWLGWKDWLWDRKQYNCSTTTFGVHACPDDIYRTLLYRASQLDCKIDSLIIKILEEWIDKQVDHEMNNPI